MTKYNFKDNLFYFLLFIFFFSDFDFLFILQSEFIVFQSITIIGELTSFLCWDEIRSSINDFVFNCGTWIWDDDELSKEFEFENGDGNDDDGGKVKVELGCFDILDFDFDVDVGVDFDDCCFDFG